MQKTNNSNRLVYLHLNTHFCFSFFYERETMSRTLQLTTMASFFNFNSL